MDLQARIRDAIVAELERQAEAADPAPKVDTSEVGYAIVMTPRSAREERCESDEPRGELVGPLHRCDRMMSQDVFRIHVGPKFIPFGYCAVLWDFVIVRSAS